MHNNFINSSISNVFMNSLFSHYTDYEFSWISFSHDNEQWWECLWKSQINQVARLVQMTSIIQTQKPVVECLKVNDIFYRKMPFFGEHAWVFSPSNEKLTIDTFLEFIKFWGWIEWYFSIEIIQWNAFFL